uniref:Uncharacterized sensor-like histidine kinase ycf26 n=1 Tax=Mastocarpus papillatus TaxID=31436 RepID=A0A342RZT1_9FLOR|nr:conserved hypothetical plastid protein [Mastocarpus papillatus]AOL58227.1 conserved hypothetical plastid protein [Mastocarpus papillatus]
MVIVSQIIATILKLWSHITLKIRFVALVTLTISVVMSGLTFWALTIIKEDSIFINNLFSIDLGTLFASNILDFVEVNNQYEVASFVEKIYLNTFSVKYILLFDNNGSLFFCLPKYSQELPNTFDLQREIFHFKILNSLFGIPLVKYNNFLKDNVIDIIIPLTKNGQILGSLDLGINSSLIVASYSKLIRNISITIFVSIWLMVIIGATFNTLIIVDPIKKLSLGMKNITAGNFNQRIELTFEGTLGHLILSFNEMSKRLESYERKNVDKLLLEKVKLETIVSSIADGAIVVDNELRILFVNRIAIKAFNWTNLDIVGKSIFDHFPLHVTDSLLPVLNDFVKSNCLYNLNYQTEELYIDLQYNSSSKKFFRFLLTAVIDHNSCLLMGVAIIIQDITREVKLNEAKNQFMANVSHELRTPLCNVTSFLETLLDYHNCLTSQQQRNFLNIANNETKRLSELVNDILDLSRLESGHHYIYNLVKVDIRKIIYDIVESSQLIANLNQITLISELDPTIKFVWAHQNSLLQVFANLISNAIKFTSIKGKIVLRVYIVVSSISQIYDGIIKNKNNPHNKKQVKLVRIEIIDEGIGIDKRDQKHVFDRFVRIENNIHTLEGTGLGLPIVKNILNKHNTQFILYSELLVGMSLSFDLLWADS